MYRSLLRSLSTLALALGTGACEDQGTVIADCNLERDPPSVVFLSPAADATVSGTVHFQVNATDDCGIAELRFLIGGDTLAQLTNWVNQPRANTFTYTFDWYSPSVPNGPVIVIAEADDAPASSDRNTGIETLQFTVANP